jgi:thioesterase domain-containing protein
MMECLAQELRSTASASNLIAPGAIRTPINTATLAAHLKVSAGELPGNILPLNALGSGMNLFCLHPGYGLVSEFQPLATALDGVATAHGVQSPIYSDPGWRADSFDAMAADYVDRICRIAPEGPICLLGWSLGGRLAISMARHVAIRKRELAFVGLVDIGPKLDRVDVTADEISRLSAELPLYLDSLRDVFRNEVSQIMSGQISSGQASSDLAMSRTTRSHRTTIAADEHRLIETMVDVVAHHRRLLRDHQYPRIDTMPHLWWAAHPARKPDETEWCDYTSGGRRGGRHARCHARHDHPPSGPGGADP